MSAAVFTFGRFNPPTSGHMALVDRIKSVAKRKNAMGYVFTGQSVGKEKNPLDYRTKTLFMKKAFAGVVVVNNKAIRQIFDALQFLNDKHDEIILVVGSDRVREFKKLIPRYLKDYNFKKFSVVSAGQRDPDSGGVKGMSASKMRAAARRGDYDAFRLGCPQSFSKNDCMAMFKAVQRGMGMKENIEVDWFSYDEFAEFLEERVVSLRTRKKMARTAKRTAKKRARIRKRKEKFRKTGDQLKTKASKQAKMVVRNKIIGDQNWSDMSLGQRARIDKILQKKQKVIQKISKKLLPKVKKQERERLKKLKVKTPGQNLSDSYKYINPTIEENKMADEKPLIKWMATFRAELKKLGSSYGKVKPEDALKLYYKKIDPKRAAKQLKESVELIEKPSNEMRETGRQMLRSMKKDMKSKVEKGQYKVVASAPSWLGGNSEFQVLKWTNKPNVDPYIMVIVSNPKRKPMQVFAYYGTHPSRNAIQFAKGNGLLESVELDEAKLNFKTSFNQAKDALTAAGIPNMGEKKTTPPKLKVHSKFKRKAEAIMKKFKDVSLEINNRMPSKPIRESVELDEADNTAAVARLVKQAVKKYVTGTPRVQSKGGKARFIMVRADKIDNKLRKMVLDVEHPKANVRDMNNISYGNISDRIISAGADVWIDALGLKVEESADLDECWDTHVQRGTKMKGGKLVPNCVPKGSVDESTPAYRKMMKNYAGSDMKKVFDILKPKGFRVGAQDDTLVRNMLKKNKNNVEKAAAEIEKRYSNRFKESLDERKMTAPEIKKKEEIVKALKRKKGDFDKRYGDASNNVMYATATKNAMKDHVEVDEDTVQKKAVRDAAAKSDEKIAAIKKKIDDNAARMAAAKGVVQGKSNLDALQARKDAARKKKEAAQQKIADIKARMAARRANMRDHVELDEAWTADSVNKNAKIGSKKGYGITIKKTGGITKTPYKHMLMTMRPDKSVRVTFDHGKNEFEGTPQSVAIYLNKLLGIKESVELDERRRQDVYAIVDKNGKVVSSKLTKKNAHKEIAKYRYASDATIVLDPDAKDGDILKAYAKKKNKKSDPELDLRRQRSGAYVSKRESVDEAIGDGKKKDMRQRKLDVALAKIDKIDKKPYKPMTPRKGIAAKGHEKTRLNPQGNMYKDIGRNKRIGDIKLISRMLKRGDTPADIRKKGYKQNDIRSAQRYMKDDVSENHASLADRREYLKKTVDDRKARVKARREMIKQGRAKVGDGKDVDHKNGNPQDNSSTNLRMSSVNHNRSRNNNEEHGAGDEGTEKLIKRYKKDTPEA